MLYFTSAHSYERVRRLRRQYAWQKEKEFFVCIEGVHVDLNLLIQNFQINIQPWQPQPPPAATTMPPIADLTFPPSLPIVSGPDANNISYQATK
jgi:hypothetical protein